MVSAEYLTSFLSEFVSPSLETFSARLIVQKLIYLGQENGASFSFSFGWYLNGPYSTSLARTMYSIATDDGVLHPSWREELGKEDKQVIFKLERLLGNKTSDPRYLELLSSAWYFLPSGRVTKQDIQNVMTKLSEVKPKFHESEVLEAVNRIASFR